MAHGSNEVVLLTQSHPKEKENKPRLKAHYLHIQNRQCSMKSRRGTIANSHGTCEKTIAHRHKTIIPVYFRELTHFFSVCFRQVKIYFIKCVAFDRKWLRAMRRKVTCSGERKQNTVTSKILQSVGNTVFYPRFFHMFKIHPLFGLIYGFLAVANLGGFSSE